MKDKLIRVGSTSSGTPWLVLPEAEFRALPEPKLDWLCNESNSEVQLAQTVEFEAGVRMVQLFFHSAIQLGNFVGKWVGI